MANANVSLVQSLYDAFGRGEVDAIANAVAADCPWDVIGTGNNPTFGHRTGPGGVKEFFATVGETWEFSEFAPGEFYAAADKVFVLGRYAARCRKGGGEVVSDFVHVFTIQAGRITKFQEFSDSAKIEAAYCS